MLTGSGLLKFAVVVAVCSFFQLGLLMAVLLYLVLELIVEGFFMRNKILQRSLLAKSDLLPAPITDKEVHDIEDEYIRLGSCAMQGWRRSMEDAHTILMSMSETNSHHRFFGVFDGHCGPAVAEWSSKHLTTHIESSAHFDEKDYDTALREGFISLDRELKRNAVAGGSTGVTVLMTPEGGIYCANVGDSRCVVCEGGKAVDLSIDHKPTLPAEHDRILRAGGFVANGRVMGSLAMSRALGDFAFKTGGNGNNGSAGCSPADEMVTAVPEVMVSRMKQDTEFMILACDGIWDCMSSQQAVDFVRLRLAESPDMPLSSISAELFKSILSPRPFGLGCDNMSILILVFKSPPQVSTQMPSSQPASSGSGVLLDSDGDEDDLVVVAAGRAADALSSPEDDAAADTIPTTGSPTAGDAPDSADAQ
eukprot:TRINITY_DN51905_c0_g1_i1.p1 TRINITY_DN51905_c0_g1~~TRINITY_DN51905_c0_g1_i1.p1  ORF type:complete len:421 (+),score=153.04 TRINITY_DN51905_c0_g1_i1:227-1489(+)